MDQSESQIFDLRVNAEFFQIDLARLISEDIELYEGLEQDLNGTFPEGATTIRNFGNTNNIEESLSHILSDIRGIIQYIFQSDSMMNEINALFGLFFDQNEILQDHIERLEKSHSDSVSSTNITL